ncbi:hypothetical protein [Peribacillus frigoritolerans]|uniref:hypothetical protein n=1 Tax=Peribacillus frigoritolerans TaxID=450367 RepID=UPI003B8E4A49
MKALVKKYTKAFKSNKSMSPHNLRHTYGSNLMEHPFANDSTWSYFNHNGCTLYKS